MPGFILHITASQMLFSKYQLPLDRDAFEVGNLIPDSVSDKTFSHFRHPAKNEKFIVYPDFELFSGKYQHLFHNSSVLGYYFHLYIDKRYTLEYLPQVVSFYDETGKEAFDRVDITHARIKRTGELVPLKTFFSEEHYYGDFTKLNTHLINRFNLSVDLNETIQNPGIEEVDYTNIIKIKQQLNEYLDVPENAAYQLSVFDAEHLIAFLESLIDGFIELLQKEKIPIN